MSDFPNTAPAGTKCGPAAYFSGTAGVARLAADNPADGPVGDVTRAPGCRNNVRPSRTRNTGPRTRNLLAQLLKPRTLAPIL